MTNEKHEYWSRLITEQKVSGPTIRAFRKERGVADHCFYFWRRRLGWATAKRVRFALLKAVGSTAPLELLLASGEPLRIANGNDIAWRRHKNIST